MATNTTSTLSGELLLYLEKRFLERSRAAIIFAEGAIRETIPVNSGKQVTFNRYAPIAVAAAISEGVNPTTVSPTGTQVTAALIQYGQVTAITDLLYVTSIDRAAKEKTDLMAQNMAETLDQLVRDELFAGGTVQFANARAGLVNVVLGDNLNYSEIRKVRRQLKKNNAIPYSDGYYLGKVGPDTAFDVMNDNVWVAAKEYSTPEDLYKGELGRLSNVRFIEATSNQKSEASTTTVFSNFFHGQSAFGVVDLDSLPNGLIIKQGGEQDTSNALNLFITVGWKAAFVAKTLNSTWLINVKCAASV